MFVDAHQHFWDPARGDYGWMPDDDPVLSRVYEPADLASCLAMTGVNKTILVQAAPSVAETEYLLDIADATPHVAKVVGWIDFENPSQIETLERLAKHPKFVGVRPMIQDLPDSKWMLRDDLDWAFRAIVDLDLTFDCLGFPQHLAHFHTLLTRHPDMRAVIDHCMKPQIGSNSPTAFDHWAAGMSQLANDTGAFCKLSGLVTEAGPDWTVEALQPYCDHVLAEFGSKRVMWGSDWPVARFRCEYVDWFEAALGLIGGMGKTAQTQIFGGTARAFYRID